MHPARRQRDAPRNDSQTVVPRSPEAGSQQIFFPLNMHTVEYLKSQLSYDQETGLLTWNVTRNRVKKGQPAGNKHLGYIRVKLNGRNYAAHRLAWLFTTGEWPKNEIDHINGIRDDNRFCNLREATHSQNLQNCVNRRGNKHGLRGIAKQTESNRWVAVITSNGIKHYLGTFRTPEEAHEAYLQAVPIHHGNFANLKTANSKEKSHVA